MRCSKFRRLSTSRNIYPSKQTRSLQPLAFLRTCGKGVVVPGCPACPEKVLYDFAVSRPSCLSEQGLAGYRHHPRATVLTNNGKPPVLGGSFFIRTRYGFGLRRAAEWLSWLPICGSPPQSLRSSSGAPAGGVLNVLSMQGIALKYS